MSLEDLKKKIQEVRRDRDAAADTLKKNEVLFETYLTALREEHELEDVEAAEKAIETIRSKMAKIEREISSYLETFESETAALG